MTELAQLSGTEKQIAWAEDIRAKKISEIEENITRIQDSIKSVFPDFDADMPAVEGSPIWQWQRRLEKLSQITSATYWIERRNS